MLEPLVTAGRPGLIRCDVFIRRFSTVMELIDGAVKLSVLYSEFLTVRCLWNRGLDSGLDMRVW